MRYRRRRKRRAHAFDELDAEDDILVLAGDAARARRDHRQARDRAPATGRGGGHSHCRRRRAVRARPCRTRQGRRGRAVEHADATPEEREIDEINPSIYCFRRGLLAPALRRLSPENAQGEYYLTDVIAVLRQAGHAVVGVEADDAMEALGVNDRAQLADAEAELRARINLKWMRAGVTMVDPTTTYIDAMVDLEIDVRLLPGTILEGAHRRCRFRDRSRRPPHRRRGRRAGAHVELGRSRLRDRDDCEVGVRTPPPGHASVRGPRSARTSR